MNMFRVGFLGLGIMGRPMARRIAEAGFTVTAWNRTSRKGAGLEGDGIDLVPAPAAAARDADAVILMVSTGAVVEELLFGSETGEGLGARLKPGASVIVMSSIAPDLARSQATRLASNGVAYLDAPVSGGEAGAKAGTLSIMVGGAASDVAAMTALLSTMGRVTHVGPSGCGQIAKLANQTIVGVTIAGVAEALLLAGRAGADIKAVAQALEGGFADSAVLRRHGARMIAGDFQAGAHASTQLKDLETAHALAAELQMPLTTLQHVRNLYRQMCAEGMAELDHSGLFHWLPSGARPHP